MPAFDRRFLLALGVLLVVVVFFVRSNTQSPVSQAQQPIDPLSLTGEFDQKDVNGEFHGQQLLSQGEGMEVGSRVLGSSDDNKRIEVDLTNQRVYAFEGDRKVFDFLVSTGKWGRTPTGTFKIWGKFRYTKMEGGSKALNTYYYLPNVPYVMFFSNAEVAASRGFSLHGTYWHSNFGTPMSHGCVNMKTEEVEQLYYWANPDIGSKKSGRATEDNPGTEVIIYGVAPKG
jgi:lipoprotein-anchoring transpeptidase ErfK/SrfK